MASRKSPSEAPEEMPVSPESPAEEPRRSQRGPSLNRVELIGRLAADPEVRYSPAGKPVATMRLATNDRSEVQYHDLVAFERLAYLAGEHLTKGRLLYVEGRLQVRSWEAQDGSRRRSVEVVLNGLQILSPKAAEVAESEF